MRIAVDGREAHAYTGGKPFDPALPCLVFVHGALHDHSVWNLAARWFAHHGHGVLAVDLPGHGQSAGPPLPAVEDAADWLLALLAAAGVRRAAVAGHSMGSLIALEAAARAPAGGIAIAHLAMLATAYPMKVSDSLLATAREAPLRAIEMVNGFSISTLAAKPSFPGPGMWLHGLNRALMRRTQRRAAQADGINLFAHDFGVCDRYANGLAAAERVQCPVTLVLGARDQMTSPTVTTAIAAALRARVVTLPAGHHLMAEVPDAVLRALQEALRETMQTAPAAQAPMAAAAAVVSNGAAPHRQEAAR